MSDRFADLTKLPTAPAARLLAEKGHKLGTPLEVSAAAPVGVVLRHLERESAWVDVVRLLAVALPPREAVWWACLAGRDLVGKAEPTPCLKAAEAWVMRPGEESRVQLQTAIDAADMDDDTALLATAALYAPGTLGPGDMDKLPAPPAAVPSCVFAMNMKSMAAAPDPLARQQWLIDRALDIARGGNGRVAEPAPAPGTEPAPEPAIEKEAG